MFLGVEYDQTNPRLGLNLISISENWTVGLICSKTAIVDMFCLKYNVASAGFISPKSV